MILKLLISQKTLNLTYRVLKIVGQDIENQMKPVFGDKIIEATVTGKELFELFKIPNEYEEQTTHEVESEEMEQGL